MPYADPLTDDELETALAGLPDWSRDGELIRRAITCPAISALQPISSARWRMLADAADHHPDVHITGYRTVTFELTTHAASALTRRDIELASEIDLLVGTGS